MFLTLLCLSVLVAVCSTSSTLSISDSRVTEGFSPYVLPQMGYIPGRGWETVTQSIQQSQPQPPSVGAPTLVPWYNWREKSKAM